MPETKAHRENRKRFGDFPPEPKTRTHRREGPVPSVPPTGAQTLDMAVVWEDAVQAALDVRYHLVALQGETEQYIMLTQEFGQGLTWTPDSGILIKVEKSAEIVQLWGTALIKLQEAAQGVQTAGDPSDDDEGN